MIGLGSIKKNDENMAFVLFRHQQHGFCFVLVNNMAFVLFQHQQHGFCFVPMSMAVKTDNCKAGRGHTGVTSSPNESSDSVSDG